MRENAIKANAPELGGRTKVCVWSVKLRASQAWRADVSCVSFHIPLQLQRKRGGDMNGRCVT